MYIDLNLLDRNCLHLETLKFLEASKIHIFWLFLQPHIADILSLCYTNKDLVFVILTKTKKTWCIIFLESPAVLTHHVE